MIRALTVDFARRLVRAAVGETLSEHYKVSYELPSLLRPLVTLKTPGCVRRSSAHSPQPTPVLPRAAAEADVLGEPSEKLKRKAASLLARAEGIRTTTGTMNDFGARKAMLRLAEIYEKLASNILKSRAPE